MKKGFLILALSIVISSFNAFALSVSTSVAGELSNLISDKDVTELVVSGSIDVRDIKFIAEEMQALKSLDLSNAQIVAYSSNIPYFGDVIEYEENMLPAYSFFDKDYVSVKLPSSLSAVGESAFAGCDELIAVTLPSGLITVGDYAFSSCSALRDISIPQSVKNIGKGAFTHCSSLLVMDLSMLEGDCAIGENVFANCTALERVILSNKTVDIPNGTFAGCLELKSVEIGENSMLESIGEGAFETTALPSFAFESCANINNIGDWAFSNAQLQRAYIPVGVKTLGEGAFFYNYQLEDVVIPQNVSELEAFVFAGATSLRDVVLSDEMTRIGSYAFENNIGMTEMTVYAVTVPELGENVFDRMNQSSVLLKVPAESVESYKSADQWKEFNVSGDMSTLEESVDAGHSIKINIFNEKLYVSASEKIKLIDVYEPGGLLLVSSMPCAETATIDVSEAGANVYIIAVQLESGTHKTVKLVK